MKYVGLLSNIVTLFFVWNSYRTYTNYSIENQETHITFCPQTLCTNHLGDQNKPDEMNMIIQLIY